MANYRQLSEWRRNCTQDPENSDLAKSWSLLSNIEKTHSSLSCFGC